MTGLVIENLEANYGDKTILDGISLSIAQGEFHVLLGPSGCGKTTLLRCIAGLHQVAKGRILMASRQIDQLPPSERELAMVFQQYALFPNMSVRKNLSFGLAQKKLSKADISSRVDKMLDMVALTEFADRLPANLSGGQRQRVALARAVILEPKILLLDEPLSALDAQIRRKLQFELKNLQMQLGVTAILVTHDQDEALMLGDYISVLDKGKIAQTGSAKDIFYRPQNMFVASFLGDANIIPPNYISGEAAQKGSGAYIIHPANFIEGEIADAALSFTGKVEDCQIIGQFLRVNIRYQDLELRYDKINQYGLQPPQKGSDMTLSCRLSDLHNIQ
ncbi:ABC transporter ATP-binding protein [Bartonella sp. HY038]|uniref:ABC transporter ATP-binding protein n=1 Tax=Bartonella sp. HY038 TaxID=2759660 RepID=UPI0015FA7BEE|nr:ABC transporter ATP-binding protein [Bartonella sp. HY038]